MRGWILTSIVISAGCASGSGGAPIPSPESPGPVEMVAPERTVDREPLERALEALKEGDRGTAAALADSLSNEWAGSERVDPGSAEDLAELLERLGAEDRAVELLVRIPFELDGGVRDRIRDLSSRLSIGELEAIVEREDAHPEALTILEAELAVALAEADRPEHARDMARRVLEGAPDDDERDRAEDVVAGRVAPLHEPIRVGVVLPATGRFETVGDQILEGVLLAVGERMVDSTLAPIELVVLDDSSSVEVGIAEVEALEEEGVVAVLGPLRTEALESVAIRREHNDLLLLSPTAAAWQGTEPNVYTLWDRRRREEDVATALITWMAEEMDLATFGVLYPGGSDAAVDALHARAGELGVEVLASRAYVADSTTFGDPIGALAAAEPEAVIVLSDRARTVLQLAPQLVYYGLRRWVIGGDATWSDPGVVRRLDASYADHRLVATYVDQVTPDTEWQRFKAAYEAEYRKTLSDNMFTALGYDAMKLILMGAPEVDPRRRGAIGRAIRRGSYDGATGVISVDPLNGQLQRDVFVRVIQDGELRVPDPEEMKQWATQQLELEEFLKALEEEKEKDEAPDEGGTP